MKYFDWDDAKNAKLRAERGIGFEDIVFHIERGDLLDILEHPKPMSNATFRALGARVAFGDIVRLSRERSNDPNADGFERYVGLDHLDPGDLKIRRWGNVSDGTTFTNVFRSGQVLFGKRRAYQRKVDEAHRTQEGDLGRKMREALPNAFLFGLTGTPINRADRNTFYAFGAEEDKAGYMSRYGFEESIRDGATMPLHFEPRLLELHIDKEAIDQAFRELTGSLSDLDRDRLAQTAAKMAVLVKAPERIQRICADIATHYQEKVAPNGFGAQVVTFDRESCVLYKKALDEQARTP